MLHEYKDDFPPVYRIGRKFFSPNIETYRFVPGRFKILYVHSLFGYAILRENGVVTHLSLFHRGSDRYGSYRTYIIRFPKEHLPEIIASLVGNEPMAKYNREALLELQADLNARLIM